MRSLGALRKRKQIQNASIKPTPTPKRSQNTLANLIQQKYLPTQISISVQTGMDLEVLPEATCSRFQILHKKNPISPLTPLLFRSFISSKSLNPSKNYSNSAKSFKTPSQSLLQQLFSSSSQSKKLFPAKPRIKKLTSELIISKPKRCLRIT